LLGIKEEEDADGGAMLSSGPDVVALVVGVRTGLALLDEEEEDDDEAEDFRTDGSTTKWGG